MALKKVQEFVSGRILETKIAGKIAASLCRCLVKARLDSGYNLLCTYRAIGYKVLMRLEGQMKEAEKCRRASFVCGCQDETNILMYNSHSLYRLKGR